MIHRLPLTVRLVGVFVLAAVIAGGLAGVVFARQLQLALESSLDTGLRAREASLVSEVTARETTGTAQAAAIDRIGGSPGVTQLLGADGRVLAASAGSGGRPLLDAGQRSRSASGVYIIDAERPVPRGAGGGSQVSHLRLLGTPLPGSNDLLVLGADRGTADDAARDTTIELFVLGLAGTIAATIGVLATVRAALRPVERARARAAAASATDEQVVLPVPGGDDELSRLVVTLNELLARQHAALQAERSFVADAGHELRTPLTVLAGELELADRPARTEAELREALRVARDETSRLIALSEQLLLLARGDDHALVRRHDCDLVDVIAAAVAGGRRAAQARDVVLVADLPGSAPALADDDRVRLAVDNLLRNATRYAPAGSEVTVSLAAEPGGGWRLGVRDHGPGFPAEFLPHAFERFRRGDEARGRDEGTGLGLAIVRSVARGHDGEATAANCPDGGALVSMTISAG